MSIFAEGQKDEAVAELRSRFAATPVLSHLAKLDDDLLYAKLLAAEAEVARRLRIFLEPTWVFPEGVAQSAIDAREPASSPYVIDPGYDYNPDFFRDNRWGYLVTRRRPIISVSKFEFVYGQPSDPVFAVPNEWLRLDRKYGHIRLVPVGAPVTLPLSQYMLSAFGGGRTIPHMLRLTYKAGIEDLQKDHPDLYDFLFRVAGLALARDRMPGGSESISVDGLSESRSFDIKAYADSQQGALEGEYKSWQQFFSGPRLAFV